MAVCCKVFGFWICTQFGHVVGGEGRMKYIVERVRPDGEKEWLTKGGTFSQNRKHAHGFYFFGRARLWADNLDAMVVEVSE